jgi:hypothetical protein
LGTLRIVAEFEESSVELTDSCNAPWSVHHRISMADIPDVAELDTLAKIRPTTNAGDTHSIHSHIQD